MQLVWSSMGSNLSHFWFVTCLVSLVSIALEVNAKPLTLNVHAGTPAGGFGDVASNMVMVRLLREKYPDAVINVLVDSAPVDDQAPSQMIATLDPRYKPTPAKQTIDGVNYILSGSGAIPKADYVLVFSAKGTEPANVIQSAPTALLFGEYTGPNGVDISRNPRGPKPTMVNKALMRGKTQVVEVFTGAGASQAGLFISKNKPSPPLSREALFNQLDNELPSRQFNKLGPDHKDVKLAFVYTSVQDNSDTYIRAVVHNAKLTKNKNTSFLIISNEPPFEIVLPPNVEVRSYSRLPLSVSEALIAHSDVAPMVTGSVSPSLALQHEKPFLYEVNNWKADFIEELKESLIRASPELAKQDDRLNRLLKARLTDLENRVPHANHLRPVQLAEILDDAELLTLVSQAMRKLRLSESLVETIAETIKILEEVGPQKSGAAYSAVIAGAKLGKTPEMVQVELATQPTTTVTRSTKKTKKKILPWWELPDHMEKLHKADRSKKRAMLERLYDEAPEDVAKKITASLNQHLIDNPDPSAKQFFNSIGPCREGLIELHRALKAQTQ